jgi:hypothetical protein
VTDILNPTELNVKYAVGVRHKGLGEPQFIAEYPDHLTALKLTNRLNCTRGLSTGDVYVLEEVAK